MKTLYITNKNIDYKNLPVGYTFRSVVSGRVFRTTSPCRREHYHLVCIEAAMANSSFTGVGSTRHWNWNHIEQLSSSRYKL